MADQLTIMSDPKVVYQVLAEHQQLGTTGWALEKVMQKLHEWAEAFLFRFKLEIPSMPLRVTRLRWNCLGHFNPGFNDFGLVYEIAIDLDHVMRNRNEDGWWEVLATLLHEQLHFWQQLNGKPAKPGPGNYHNRQYREKARALGLNVSDRGVNEGYDPDGPFLKLLKERNIKVPDLVSQRRVPSRVGSKLKKWSCGCEPKPVNLRVAVEDFQAMCMKCNRLFTRQ